MQFGRGSSYANYEEPVIPEEQQIECKICKQIFKNTITPAHLRLHKMTTTEYKKLYGDHSLKTEYIRNEYSKKYRGENNPNYNNSWSDEQKAHLSKIKKEGHASGLYIPHQKGKPRTEEQKLKQSTTMKALYANGTLIPFNKGMAVPPEVRSKISKSIKEYAANNPEEMTRRGKLSYETRLKNGTWKPIINTYSTERRAIISANAKKHAKIKSEKSYKKLYKFITDEGYTILHMDGDSKGYIEFICNCGSGHTHKCTRGLFDDSKYIPYNGWCRFCDYTFRSRGEFEITEFIHSFDITTINNYITLIYPSELDIYIPEHKIAIEFNGVYWHSELAGKDKHYHNKKRNRCEKKGVRLLQFFEDEWNDKQEIAKSIITQSLNRSIPIHLTDNHYISEMVVDDAKLFFDETNIFGFRDSDISYGLYDNGELLSALTFKRINDGEWLIVNSGTILNHIVVGGYRLILQHFIEVNSPTKIISYSDLRFDDVLNHDDMGFRFVKNTAPTYWYFKMYATRYHKDLCQNGMIDGDDPDKTEWENRVVQGWNRVWDCGCRMFVWDKSKV